jgi:hypothetical protein
MRCEESATGKGDRSGAELFQAAIDRLPTGRDDEVALEKRAQRRAALADTILGRRCLPACERLFDWSNDLFSDTWGLAAAAEEVITAAQQELLGRESPLEPGVGFELGYARASAVFALCEVSTQSVAKSTELRLTDDAPLTICTGFTRLTIKRVIEEGEELRYAPFLGSMVKVPVIHRNEPRDLYVPAFGCFAIFLDTTQKSRKAWRHWCDDCKASTSQRPRQVERAHRRVVALL